MQPQLKLKGYIPCLSQSLQTEKFILRNKRIPSHIICGLGQLISEGMEVRETRLDFVNVSPLQSVQFIAILALFLSPENCYTPSLSPFIIVRTVLALQQLQRNFYFCLRLTIPFLSILFLSICCKISRNRNFKQQQKQSYLLIM